MEPDKGPSVAVKNFYMLKERRMLPLGGSVQNQDYHVCALFVWFILLIVNSKCSLD